jgi:hypothetical protein
MTTTTDQFWAYAEEAMLDARHSKNGTEKRALLDLARMWTQAALRSEGEIVVIAGQAAKGASANSFPVLQHLHKIGDLPKLISDTSGHGGGDAKRFMDAHKIIVGREQGDVKRVILDLL